MCVCAGWRGWAGVSHLSFLIETSSVTVGYAEASWVEHVADFQTI